MATLSTMRDRIKSDLVLSGSAYDAQIDDAIRSSIRFYTARPLWFLEQKTTLTLASGDDSVSLPSDFAAELRDGVRILISGTYYANNSGFDRQEWDVLEADYRYALSSGTPRNWAIYAGSIFVDALASDNYTISISYIKKDATLPTGDTDTSVWFDEGYDAIRTRALAIFKDESLEYQNSQADWARADRYWAELVIANNMRKAGA